MLTARSQPVRSRRRVPSSIRGSKCSGSGRDPRNASASAQTPVARPGEPGGSQRGGLEVLRPANGQVQDVRLELHHPVVGCGAAIDGELPRLHARVGLHGHEHVVGGIRHGLQRSAGQVACPGAAGETHQRSPGLGLPVGRAETHERRNEIDAIVGREVRGHTGGLRRHFQAGPVRLAATGRGARHEDRTLEGVGWLPGRVTGDGGEEAGLRGDSLLAGVQQEECAGAVRVLGQAGPPAPLPEECRLLVPRDACRSGERPRTTCGSVSPKMPLDGRTSGSTARGTPQERQQLVIPLAAVDVVQHRAGGVGRVGGMDTAARQLPDQPAVDGAGRQLACLGARACASGTLSSSHSIFVPEKYGSITSPVRAPHELQRPVRLQLPTARRRTPVLPDDGVVDRARPWRGPRPRSSPAGS